MPHENMLLDIVSAESSIFKGDVSFIAITGQMGELGISPGHTALLTALKPGQITATLANGSLEVFYLSGGMLEVQPDVVTLLADTAKRADDLDEAAALAIKERAEKALLDNQADMDYSTTLGELAEAAAQLRAIQKLRDRFK